MSRNKGTFNFAANFEVLAKAPLDARQVVDVYSNLTNPSTWLDSNGNNWLYKGAIVSVSNDPSVEYNGVYFLSDETSYTNASSWIQLGLNTSIGSSGKNYQTQILGNDISTNFIINHNLNTKNHIISIYDTNDNEIYPDKQRGLNTDIINFFTPPSTGEIYDVVIIGF